MPADRKAWASWNFIGHSGCEADTAAVCVTYWLNLLQHLPPTAPDLFVTLNPRAPPAADKTIRRLPLGHPVFSHASWAAQQRVRELQGAGGVFYAGAWCGWGFHEDGMKSAVAVLAAMGLALPWVPRATSPKASLLQSYFLGRLQAWAAAGVVRGGLRVVLPSGADWRCGEAAPGERPRLATPAYESEQLSPAGTGVTAVHAQASPLALPPAEALTGARLSTCRGRPSSPARSLTSPMQARPPRPRS